MALPPLINGESGLSTRNKINASLAAVDAVVAATSNVTNTSDANKPVSTAQQAALDLKAPLASPAFTGTPTGLTKAHVGLGNVDNTADTAKPVSTAQLTALNLKAPLASPTFTGTVSGVTAAMVGLANVSNTSDTAKPVSTAQQAALDLKAPLASPTFTGTVSGVTAAMVGLANVDNTSDVNKPVSTAQQTAFNTVYTALSEKGLVALIIGDSITNANVSTTGTSKSLNARGWFNVLQWTMGGPFSSFINKGVDGATTTQIDARWATDVVANYALFDVLFYWAGTNDIRAGATAISIFNRIAAKAAEAASKGKLVVLGTCMSCASTFAWTATQLKRVHHLNQMLADFAAITPNVVCFDAYRATVVPSTGVGDLTLLYDGLHPSAMGAWEIAQKQKEVLTPILAVRQPRGRGVGSEYDATDNPGGNWLANGSFIGAAGSLGTAATGQVATSWSVTHSGAHTSAHVTCSKEAQTSGASAYMGERQVVAVNIPSGTSASERFVLTQANITATFAPGDKFVAEIGVEITGLSGLWTSLHFRLIEDDGTAVLFNATDGDAGSEKQVRSGKLLMRTPILTARAVGGGSRYLALQYFAAGNASAAALIGTFAFSEASVRKVA